MKEFYSSIDKYEVNRIENLEPFDEYEEFDMKCHHYRLLIASNDKLLSVTEDILPKNIKFSTKYDFNLDLREVEITDSNIFR